MDTEIHHREPPQTLRVSVPKPVKNCRNLYRPMLWMVIQDLAHENKSTNIIGF